MPAKSSWLTRIPEIVTVLSAMKVPVVDRRAFEELFHVRRRRAADLVQRFGGYRAGNTSLVDRQILIQQLRRLECDPDVIRELARKHRIAVELEEARLQSRAAQIVTGRRPTDSGRRAWTMPAGVSFSGNALRVEFSDPEDLLFQLYQLSQAAAASFEHFCEVITSGANSVPIGNSGQRAHVPAIR